MQSHNLDPIAVFDESFPSSFQEAVVELLRMQYAATPDIVRSFARAPHDKDPFPVVRRAMIEGQLEELVTTHDGLTVRPEKNRSGNTHIVVEAPHFILTESYARSPRKIVRWAAYRAADSLVNYPLFAKIDPPDDIQKETKFNAVLLHGYSNQNRDELGFAVIRFPSPGFKSYLPDLINLLDRFPATTQELDLHAMEEIPDAIEPKIRTGMPLRRDS